MNNVLEPEPDRAAEELLEEIALGPDAAVIVHALRDAVRRTGLYEGAGDNLIARVEGCDVRVSGKSFLIPRPVDEDYNAFLG